MPIIINSRSCSDAGWWTNHLKKAETNERVEVIGFYGLSADTIEDAFSEMRVMAQGSKRTKNFFSQYNINPRADEHLTEAQWEEAHALHRKNHGLDHLPYFRVRHIKDGREHEHGIALRVDPEIGKAISDSLTAADNERTSRALEIRFDLERGRSILTRDREIDRPERRPKKRETFREGERKIDMEIVKADALSAKQRADNGQSFKTALEASGDYVLARGDRRDFVIIDRAGEAHSLAKRLGMKTAEVRAFVADLDPASLPSVEQAKARQRGQETAQEAHRQPAPEPIRETWAAAARSRDEPPQTPRAAPEPAPEAKPVSRLRGTMGQMHAAWRESYDPNPATDPGQLAQAFAARGIHLAQATPEEAYASERRAALGKAARNYAPAWREGEIVAVDPKGAVYRLNERTTGGTRAVIEGRLAGIDSAALPSIAAAKDAAREASRAALIEKIEAERAEARRNAPINQAAGEIRLAWQLSRDDDQARAAAQLGEALEGRGFKLAALTAAEAEASRQQNEEYRARKLAQERTQDAAARGRYGEMQPPEPGRYAPQLEAGEIVAVDRFGSAHRLDERTTGNVRPEIEARLSQIDRDGLLSVADAKAAMIEASRAAWIAEREATRPATALEGRIIECAEQARHFGAHVQKDEQGAILLGADALAYRMRNPDERTGEAAIVYGQEAFAARLDAAGIAIVRVTAADIPALDALRQGEDMARLAAETNNDARKQHHFAPLEIGELAAVTRGGDVHRINADKLHGVDIAADLPSVTEARKSFEIDRAQTDALYDLRRADFAAARDAFADRQELGQAMHAAETVVHATFETPLAAAAEAVNAVSGFLGGAVKLVEGIGNFLGGLFGGPKPTRQQAHEAAQARGNEETLHARDYAATVEAKEAEFDDRMHAQKTSQQQEDLSSSQRTGRPATREANLGRDDDYGRERER